MTDDIANESCVPCRGGMAPLTPDEARDLLGLVPGWTIDDDGKAIRRRRTYKNYKAPLAAVVALSAVAEAERHHPDVSFGWGYLEVVLRTHSIDGLHRNDFVVAAKIDAALGAD